MINLITCVFSPLTKWLRKQMAGKTAFTAFLKIIRRWPEKNFREYISNYRVPGPPPVVDTSPYQIVNLPVCRLGPKNRGKVIMLLENQSYHAGFCALWVYFLNRLSFSDRMGFVHCINWNQSDFYQEKKPIHGTTSIFEYYFQQPGGISVEDAKRSDSVIFDYNCPQYDFDSVFHVGEPYDYQFTDKDIEDFAVIQKKYIHLQPNLERKFNKQIGNLFKGKKVLGVHARGADSKVGYKGHPVPISAVDYLITAKKDAEAIKADKIFLATDDADILDLFIGEFGDKLIYFDDVTRSRGTVMNCYEDAPRKLHHYKLGLEIVRDVYALAACHGLVCGMSYVSFMAQIVKRSFDKRFESFNRLFNGLASEGVDLTSQKARDEVGRKWKAELEAQHDAEKQSSQNQYRKIKERDIRNESCGLCS